MVLIIRNLRPLCVWSSPLLIAAGLLASFLVRSEGARAAARALLALGLVLFGLHTIGDAAAPLEGAPAVRE